MSGSAAIAATRCWVEKVVVGMNLCPFARPVVETGRIRFVVSDADDFEPALTDFAEELARLDTDETTETSLFILPGGFADFDHYLDLLAMANALLVDLGYEGVYQLASFHPEYQFESSEPDDPANCTNRSPYPMFHLIREESLARALADFPNPEKIPGRNVEATRAKGLEAMRKMLADCGG